MRSTAQAPLGGEAGHAMRVPMPSWPAPAAPEPAAPVEPPAPATPPVPAAAPPLPPVGQDEPQKMVPPQMSGAAPSHGTWLPPPAPPPSLTPSPPVPATPVPAAPAVPVVPALAS